MGKIFGEIQRPIKTNEVSPIDPGSSYSLLLESCLTDAWQISGVVCSTRFPDSSSTNTPSPSSKYKVKFGLVPKWGAGILLIVRLMRLFIMITFASFISKYPEFTNESGRFAAFLPDAIAEVDYYKGWGTLRESGIELLVAHKITLSSPAVGSFSENGETGVSSGTVKKIDVSDESYSVEYQDNSRSSNGGYTSTRYGSEYLRLLGMIGTQTVKPINSRGTSFVGKRGENNLPW
jgi:Protein of unknown function (DUF4054)